MDVNSAIQRSIVKEIARHGLGINVHKGAHVPDPTPAPPDLPSLTHKSPSSSAVEDVLI